MTRVVDPGRRAVRRQAVSVAAATGVYGVSFGALAVAAGLSVGQTAALSLLMFTGGSQFAFVGVIGGGGALASATAAASLLGVRNAIYGVTANAIAPSAATRLTATVPESQKVSQGRNEEDPSRSPDNVAPICAYLASERSSWLSGRTIAAGGYGVDLYSNPEIIASAKSDGPWTLEDLATKVEANFKPVADGLPYSLFAGQVQRAATK